ncbi:aspartic peptidase domain-containing protein [Phaeosphaeria sp. MPI-PUGE-AT-0046c]|nr:aspartic peptidase domain-containing protein [Phaeosphaeria sp. MPI-PUGE-AT-0046c]
MGNNSNPVLPFVVPNSGRWLGNDGTWSAFDIYIGSPPQRFNVLPSINGQTFYVPIDLDCERYKVTDCGSGRGVQVFKSQVSPGFQPNSSSSWSEIGIYPVNIGTGFGLTGNGIFGFDTAGLGTGASSENVQLIAQAISAFATSNPWIGQLGLSQFPMNVSDKLAPHSFLSRLKEEGHIPSLSFGYQAGAIYRYTRVPGSLILGGYDRSRSSMPSLLIPSTSDIIVGLQSIATSFPNGTSTKLLTTGILPTIDTAVPELWLPTSVCNAFASAFGLDYDTTSDRYTISASTHDALQASPPNVTFTIGSSISGGQTINIQVPYAAFDLKATYPIFPNTTLYFPIRRAANESQYALGRSFMQEIYLTVDWERDVFNISQAVFNSPMPTSNIVTIKPVNRTGLVSTSDNNNDNSKKLSAGAIAGIAIGALLTMCLILGGIWFMRRRKAKEIVETTEIAQVDQKHKDVGVGPEAVDLYARDTKPVVGVAGTDAELDGREVPEMYAPLPTQQQKHSAAELHRGHEGDMAEAEGSPAIYELPTR